MLKIKVPMRRMDYLIKSDRINVLRKQYDAFLEEDKKRKDRNDYILGRLDKMRYSSTAIQLRDKPNPNGDVYSKSHNRPAYRPGNVERNDKQMVQVNQQIARPYQSLPLDIPRICIEETSLLKEISKKYILIPKLSSMFPNDKTEAIPPQVAIPAPSDKPNIDNNDWKSKYDILEQLKKNEKYNYEEGIQFTSNDDHTNNREAITKSNLDKEIDHVMQKYKTEDLPPSHEEEIPEKDVSDQLVVENELKSLEQCTIDANIHQMPRTVATHVTHAQPLGPENVANYNEDTTQKRIDAKANENMGSKQYIPVDKKIEPLEYQQQEYAEQEYPPQEYSEKELQQPQHYPVDPQEYSEQPQHYPVDPQEYSEQELQQPQHYPVDYEQETPVTEVDTSFIDHEVYQEQEENEYSPIGVINPTELVQEINKEGQEAMQEGENDYPIEIINTPDFTPNDAVILEDGQNVNPHYESMEPIYVQENAAPQMESENPPNDNLGIEEFDAEQREMFYSEQADDNYAYEQQGAGDAYNQYAQNENYPQTQDYAFYEGAEQEQTYPVEINEHEETQQLYDQHYEQQYATNYEPDFEQNQVHMEQDPTQQQFEQPALYDQAQQEFDQYNHDQPADTLEKVEQVLDHEDGYIQKQKEEPAVQEKQGGHQSEEKHVL